MNIQPIQVYNVSMQGVPNPPKGGSNFLRKIGQKILNIFPEKTFKESNGRVEKFKKYDNFISKPAENRIIMGATALLTQPAIDYYNHRVDDETRTVSRNRTIAKILAGTAVGVIVRDLCFRLTDKMTDINGKGKYAKKLLPQEYLPELTKYAERLKNHKSAVATIIALLAMSVTNIFIDAPLTAYLTNKFNSASGRKKQNKPEQSRLKEGIYV
ncbi:hypothetical protein IKQ21_01470 [bacterium]|nr:hypothetical protein [bacterium]